MIQKRGEKGVKKEKPTGSRQDLKEKARKGIREFATMYGLEYEDEWFRCLFVSYPKLLITKFLAGGPLGDWRFDDPGTRAKKLDEFLSSDFYEEKVKEKAATAHLIVKRSFEGQKNAIEKINDQDTRERAEEIYKEIENNLSGDYLILLPETEANLLPILVHEWSHVLINKNDLPRKGKGYDWFNEGLAKYIEYRSINKLDKLEENYEEVEGDRPIKKYLEFAIKWKRKLKDARSEKDIIEEVFSRRSF